MRKFGWGGTLVVAGLALVVAAMPAAAGTVNTLSISGPATVDAGQGIVLTATLDSASPHDSMIWDAVFSAPGGRPLSYTGYSLAGNVQYQNGSPDDFSNPRGALDTGVLAGIPVGNGTNAHFEAVTRSGMTFTSGALVTMNLTVPSGAEIGDEFTVTPVIDSFANGFDTVDVVSGGIFRLTVVPEPATLALLGLGGLLAARRRFFA